MAELPRRTLVLGGARSGKSWAAEHMLRDRTDTIYVATGYPPSPDDEEWAERVARHRARRPATWTSVETIDLVPLLTGSGPPLLIDCLTLWLTRILDACGAWESGRAGEAEQRIGELAAAWESTPRTVVAVSNDVGSGVVPETRSGRLFQDLMGVLNTAIGRRSESVLWCVAGRVVPL